MINVNLLPHHLRPVKRTPLPYIFCLAILVAALLFMGSTYQETRKEIMDIQGTLSQNQKDIDELKDVIEESNDLVKRKCQLAEQLETINEIVSDRMIWSRQLWNLARLSLDNMWYDSISIKTKQFSESIDVMNPQTKQMERKTQQIKRRILEISGWVVQGEGGTSDVSDLLIATERDPEFSKIFKIHYSNLKDTDFEGYKVRKFSVEYLIQDTSEAENND